MARLKDNDDNDYVKAWDKLAEVIGTASGHSSGYYFDTGHMTIDQQLKVAEIGALLSISQEINHLRHAINDEDFDK
ncbi:MAG: hypothetical protein DI566_04245 [Microbacterium sp.]|nr:MAG: hypothetical protein DI566_04245 [Microbacterium sp.]